MIFDNFPCPDKFQQKATNIAGEAIKILRNPIKTRFFQKSHFYLHATKNAEKIRPRY